MKKSFVPYILSLCLLSGCGQEIVQAPVIDSATPVMANADAVTTNAIVSEEVVKIPPQNINLEIKDPIGIYEKVNVRDVISHVGIQLTNGITGLDTNETGVSEVVVKYIYDGKRYEHKVSYTVEDTEPPVLLRSGDGSVVTVGESFDINDHVGFADNYDAEPTITYTGTVDTSTVGTYPITAIATDSSGNETTWDFNITVDYEEPEYVDDNTRISFENFTEQYSEEGVAFGIDVSRWQGEIDFEAVKNAGCEYVIMRIGSYYDEYTVDEYFYSNMEKATAVGLKVGVYIYTTANTEGKVIENANWIIEQLDGQKLDFPIVFDWEEFSSFQKYNMSINDLNKYYTIFDDELEKHGYDAMLYSSKNFLNNFWYEHSDSPIWLAHYTDQTDYDGEYAIWQASCFGNIDGIEGDVDFNILYTDKADFYK